MTTKQKLAASKLQETAGNVSKAMKLAGYSKASAKDPQRLTRSKGWKELMEKYLPDKRLLKVHKGLLENKDWRARDKELLAKHRKDFCLDDVEGQKAVLNLDNIMRFVDEMKEKEKKDKNPIYQKARQLKTLKIGQLKELLEKAIEKENYQDLAFAKPEMGQYVIIDFSVNDMKEDRTKYDSQNSLKKLIKSVLEDTNWRLMSEGIHYRLGILTGRLKAYEKEEDLVKLVL